MKHNHPKITHKWSNKRMEKTSSGYELRGIPVLHTYASINKQSQEFLVLDFDEDFNLVDFNVCVNDFLYQKFVHEGNVIADWENRLEIIKFLEKYRTAYLTRDIETIDLMFAEDALIIVGRKIEKKSLSPDMVKYQKIGKEPDYEYLKLKKTEYLVRQRQIFDFQEDISLDFASFDITRKNLNPNIYGVEMRQNYLSTTYSDEGYLFLLLDFEPDNPLIYVRAWQPNTWNEEELIKTANYKIYK